MLPRLVEELARYAAMQKRSALYRQLARADLIVIDDFGLTPLADETVRDLLEILNDRYDRKSTLLTSQLPVDQWHTHLGDRTVADAILDRLVDNSYRLVLKGEPMRKRRNATSTTSGSTTVGAMLARRTTRRPQRLLQLLSQCQGTLPVKDHACMGEARVSQPEVIGPVIERNAGHGHCQLGHVREVGQAIGWARAPVRPELNADGPITGNDSGLHVLPYMGSARACKW